MRKIMFVLAAMLGVLATAQAQEIRSAFEQKAAEARAAYDQGNFPEAAKKYLELKNQGLESAEVYYNLANAEFKSNHLGLAIAYDRRAQRRAPGDEDIRYNLEYLRSLVQKPEDKSSVVEKFFQDVLQRFSGQSLALAALGAYIVFCAGLGLLIAKRGQGLLWRWLAGIACGVFLLLATFASLVIAHTRTVRWGVVVVQQAEARNGPGPENQVGFTVPEGREVRILSQENDWKAIGLSPEGYKGWVKNSEVWEDE